MSNPINHKSTPRELAEYLASPVVLPASLDSFSEFWIAHNREMAHRCALVQSYCLCAADYQQYVVLSLNVSKMLRELEEDAKQCEYDLYPDSIVNA